MGGQRGMRGTPSTNQLEVHEIDIQVASDGTISEGSDAASVVRNGAGDYTITLRTPYQRILGAYFSPYVEDLSHKVVLAADSVQVVWANNSGTDTDTGFCGVLRGSFDLIRRG